MTETITDVGSHVETAFVSTTVTDYTTTTLVLENDACRSILGSYQNGLLVGEKAASCLSSLYERIGAQPTITTTAIITATPEYHIHLGTMDHIMSTEDATITCIGDDGSVEYHGYLATKSYPKASGLVTAIDQNGNTVILPIHDHAGHYTKTIANTLSLYASLGGLDTATDVVSWSVHQDSRFNYLSRILQFVQL
ncbi:uncharacterized protein B0P05DRAFT_167380 [Gilbertella persicaria]|uniref:uncharacterized protein n=1 Tax=Gilbertella persicaria TaxID=101096 RepID=UPI00222020D6|nr:uncharacterized protein B0P05DRAFT_167380 [Gilbertella persicaria]KAI8094908.1 hypothetical protein B0P05DRAFT_167380 [Gilbertella persicaria]